MNALRVFFDCESTDAELPLLISAGFVSEDGDEFYAELSDSWGVEDCSPAVRASVLPLLDGTDAQRLTTREFADRLALWLGKQAGGRPIVFLSGSAHGWGLVADSFLTMDRGGVHSLFPHCQHQSVDRLPHSLGWSEDVEQVFADARQACFDRYDGMRNHALIQARALREAYRAAAEHPEVVRSVHRYSAAPK